MNDLMCKRGLVLLLGILLLLVLGCHETPAGKNKVSGGGGQWSGQEPEVVEIGSLDDLLALFKKLHYTNESWVDGNREVPRISFDYVWESWKKTSSEMPVDMKKQVFFRLMGPPVLMSNEKILEERTLAETGSLDSPELTALAVKYKVLADPEAALTEEQRRELLLRVDILPPSLVLAQAAEESGWGSSRFAIEGNSFFGQWDFSGQGMTPKEQRKELGNYGLARFDSPLASVEGYMLNINTNAAYRKLRDVRAQLRAEKKRVTGLELAGTLDKYSERGQAYIDGLREMIRHNKLAATDEAYLSEKRPLRLVRKGER